MRFVPHFRIDLRRLILLLAFLSALVGLGNALYASYRVQRQQLIDTTLEANRVYAAKLASTTDIALRNGLEQLKYSAALLGADGGIDTHLADAEAKRLKQQSLSFNSTAVVAADGRLLAIAPHMPELLGRVIKSEGSLQALSTKRTLISKPFVSSAGNLVVTLSQPIQRPDGAYAGYVAGTIYLREASILHALLDSHHHRDGTQVYVVDLNGRLIYHANHERAGETIRGNAVIDTVRKGRHGAQRTINSKGVDMLAGYAPVTSSGWGIVTQRPTESTLAPLSPLMAAVVWKTIPVAALLLLGIWWCARQISLPMWRLASSVRHRDTDVAVANVSAVRAWYYEVEHLKQAVLASLNVLRERIGHLGAASMADPLTGLQNRRGLQARLDSWALTGQRFSIVMVDIDHFKQVNDQHGHATGDQVIQALAQLMRDASRASDFLCRSGGEEFLMLLPDLDLPVAAQVAERLRERVSLHTFSGAGHVSISLGVSHFPDSSNHLDRALRKADKALYQAKSEGRNRVVVWQES